MIDPGAERHLKTPFGATLVPSNPSLGRDLYRRACHTRCEEGKR